MLSEHGVHIDFGGVEREHDQESDQRLGAEKGDREAVSLPSDQHVFSSMGDGSEHPAEVGGAEEGCGADSMMGHNSSYFSLGVKLTPEPRQVDTPLRLVWSNPNKKQSRKKYWANLKLVWDRGKAA